MRAAALVGEDVIAGLARFHVRDAVDRQRLGPFADVPAVQFELTHVREVEEPGALAHGVVLGQDARVLDRHLEAAERHHARPKREMRVVERGTAKRT